MDVTEHAYCRLCATCKPSNKLIDLQEDIEKREKIENKLTVLKFKLDFNESNLPKTICLVCFNSLSCAAEFVIAVERAQVALKDLTYQSSTQAIKMEINSFDSEEIVYEMLEDKYEDDIDIKSDLDTHNADVVSKPDAIRHDKKRKLNDIDSLPLSQLKQTWKEYNWTCFHCETQFPTCTKLITHSIEYHNTCNTYRCSDCSVKKFTLNRFLNHVHRVHRKYLRYSCHICFEIFETSYKVLKHKRANHMMSAFKCEGCNTNFPSLEALNNHSKLFYKKAIRSKPEQADLVCSICNKKSKTKSNLKAHLLTHADSRCDHTCEVCGKCFMGKHALHAHLQIHNNHRPFLCEICKSTFKTKLMLRRHVATHDNVKPYSCEKCGRCFRLKTHLSSHSIIHTDSLPHVCSFCNKRFRFKTILIQHIRQHTGVKPYSCEKCERDFTNWPNYNKHMKRKHNMNMAKKKPNSEGLASLDVNGKMINPEVAKILEWKNELLGERRRGRPRLKRKANVRTKNVQINSI